MKIKTTLHIYYSKYQWEEEGKYSFYSIKVDDTDYQTYVGSQEMEIEVPDGYDPRPQKIAALEKRKQEVMADFQKTVDQINERISKLQAIEFTA